MNTSHPADSSVGLRVGVASLALALLCAACGGVEEPASLEDADTHDVSTDEETSATATPTPDVPVETSDDIETSVQQPADTDMDTDAGPDVAGPVEPAVEPLDIDLLDVPKAPGRLFRAVPADQLSDPPASNAVAIADFNGDRRADFFVPGIPPVLYLNEGDAGFTKVSIDVDWPLLLMSVAAMDIDSDGRTDIVVGRDEHIQAVFNRDDGWELGSPVPTAPGGAVSGFTFIPDYDGDTRPDGILVFKLFV